MISHAAAEIVKIQSIEWQELISRVVAEAGIGKNQQGHTEATWSVLLLLGRCHGSGGEVRQVVCVTNVEERWKTQGNLEAFVRLEKSNDGGLIGAIEVWIFICGVGARL